MRIAIIGSDHKTYDEVKLEAFLYAVVEKYPHATIVTGNGRGAEGATKALAEGLGLTVEQPPLRDDLYGDKALACQINDVLIGAEQIIIVGNVSGTRPATAIGIYKRTNFSTWQTTRTLQALHVVAALPKAKKAAPARRASKPDRLAA